VFIRDMIAGTTVRVSVGTGGQEGDAASSGASLSGDGRFVVFESSASTLVTGDANKQMDVFLRDLQLGATERISVSSSGSDADGASQTASVSDDGHYVAFASTATNLSASADTNHAWDVYVRDRTNGTTSRASVSSTGNEGDGHSFAPALSADGRFVAFQSDATNLVPNDTNQCSDVFVRDLVAGVTTRVSVGVSGAQANGGSIQPSISGDGRFIAFVSTASNLVVSDTNGVPDVFVYDQQTGTVARASVGPLAVQAERASARAVISRDGRFIAFPSDSTQLVTGDSNGASDVFVRGPMF
jgi:Tol biopolymer transport system component